MMVEQFDPKWTALAAGWLSKEENWKWLQFGSGTQKLDPVSFRIMIQRPIHYFHLIQNPLSTQPIGLVALSQIDSAIKSASLWYVLGNKTFEGQGFTTLAVNNCIRYGFKELGLNSIQASVIPENVGSVRVLEKNHFNYVGTQRQCHIIDGTLRDRRLYDLLANEYVPIASGELVLAIP